MKSVRKIFLTLFFVIFVLSSCVSNIELDRAKEYEDIAETFIKQFVSENYTEYKIESIKDVITYKNIFEGAATKFVRASLVAKNDNNDRFEIIVDSINKSVYSNKEASKIIDDIRKRLELPDDCIVEIAVQSKHLRNLGVNADNFIKIGTKSEYDIIAYIGIKKNQLNDKIYSGIEKLTGVDYKIKIVASENEALITGPYNIYTTFEKETDLINDACTILTIQKENNHISENLWLYQKIDVDGGYLIHNSCKNKVKVEQVDTMLGKSYKTNASSDSRITIINLDSDVSNSDIHIYSKGFNNLISIDRNTLVIRVAPLKVKNILMLPFDYDYYNRLENGIDRFKEGNLTLALYAEE